MINAQKISVHFIIGSKVYKKWLSHLPSKGHEVRLDNEFYTVGRIVWCPKEQLDYERVNIELILNAEH